MRSPPTAPPLAGAGVLITRPAHQAQGLSRAVAACGGRPLGLPSLVIVPEPKSPLAGAVAPWLAHTWGSRLALFTSANAVPGGRVLLGDHLARPNTTVVALGPATAGALEACGVQGLHRAPSPYTSEAALTLPCLAATALAETPVALVKGVGGRDLLGPSLTARGARVVELPVYRRRPPDEGREQLAAWLAADAVQLGVVASVETLHNLFDLADRSGQDDLRRVPLVTMSPRVEAAARQRGVRTTAIAPEASDRGLLQALIQLHRGRYHPTSGSNNDTK